MTTKQYYFLTGLPRSGNTLLAALLNQNKDIYVSPLSPLPEVLFQLENIKETNENTLRNVEQRVRVQECMSTISSVFYSNIKSKVIIDRNKSWGSPVHLPLIKNFINPRPKIIYTVRNITDIIASYINLDIKFFKDEYFSGELYSSFYLNDNDGMADYIMRLNGPIDSALCNLANCLKEENKKYIHIVEYDDLVKNPSTTMQNIYKFLELEDYNHNFDNIKKIELDDDSAIGLPPNMHKVGGSIEKSKTYANDVLSEYSINKYSNMEFWRKNSLLKLKGDKF